MGRLDEYRSAASRLDGEYRKACDRIADEEVNLRTCLERELAAVEAGMILQVVSQEVQQQAHGVITALVSRCLYSVFDDAPEFKIDFDRKRGRTEARVYFSDVGGDVEPDTGSAGGVIDVAAMALRLACVLLTKPPLRRVLVLDEPCRFVHGDENRERMRELMMTLPKELGIQIIFCTGLDWLKCGSVVEV